MKQILFFPPSQLQIIIYDIKIILIMISVPTYIILLLLFIITKIPILLITSKSGMVCAVSSVLAFNSG